MGVRPVGHRGVPPEDSQVAESHVFSGRDNVDDGGLQRRSTDFKPVLRFARALPAGTIGAADEGVGLGRARERELGGVPLQDGLGKTRGDTAEEHRLGQRAGIREGRGGVRTSAENGIDVLEKVIVAFRLLHRAARGGAPRSRGGEKCGSTIPPSVPRKRLP